MARMMKAAVLVEPGRVALEERPVPSAGPGEAVIKVTTTSICQTELHILGGVYPMEPGRILGHETIGVIEELGPGVEGYEVGQRVIAGALSPCGHCVPCMNDRSEHCGGHPFGGWHIGNDMDGAEAEYVRVPHAANNLAPIPDGVKDEQVLICPCNMTGAFNGVERAEVKFGDTVAVFGQGPIGLCAVGAARLKGAGQIIAVDNAPNRLEVGRKLGADVAINFDESDPIEAIRELTGGHGVDVAIEAGGVPKTFIDSLKVLRSGGTLSSLGVFAEDITIPADAFLYGIGNHKIVTTFCPGGKERMRRLINVIAAGRFDTAALVTHRFKLDQIEDAYDIFKNYKDGVLKVAITP